MVFDFDKDTQCIVDMVRPRSSLIRLKRREGESSPGTIDELWLSAKLCFHGTGR